MFLSRVASCERLRINYISHKTPSLDFPESFVSFPYRSKQEGRASGVLKFVLQVVIMLGQAVRRFATSAVRSSHYAEGPGNVRLYFLFKTYFSNEAYDAALC